MWMLTGDKFETAKNIGRSTGLITEDFKLYEMKDLEDVPTVLTESIVRESIDLHMQQPRQK